MKRIMTAWMVILTLTLATAAAANGDPIKTDKGLVSGIVEDGVRAYKGIPFAAPPVGDLRWRPPQPAAAWEGVRECAEFGDECPQAGYAAGSMYARPEMPQSEDCLFLNIWTDAKSADEKRPVMVWIHGGALTRGSGSTPTYNGASLAKKGVVLVTLNYRLGALGYLAHPELTAESKNHSSGNYGILDQVAALAWVQRNIAGFGGDPDRVTIFGESAGSWSVNLLVATPLAKGLFHRAIGESGGVFEQQADLSSDNGGGRSAEDGGVAFAKSLGADNLAAMRAVSVKEIVAKSGSFRTRSTVDGWVLPDQPRTIFAEGNHNDVPVIVGSNANEWTSLSSPASVPKTLEALGRITGPQYGDSAGEFAEIYGAASDETAGQAYLAAMRDIVFTLQMRTWARMTANGDSPAYLYYFTRVPPIPNSEYLGAFHAAEIAYAFGNLSESAGAYEAPDHKLSEVMSSYWVNFAATGDPNGEGLPEWDAYDTVLEPYMELGDAVKQGNHLLKAELDFQERVAEANGGRGR